MTDRRERKKKQKRRKENENKKITKMTGGRRKLKYGEYAKY
jgi:hypothetical protein